MAFMSFLVVEEALEPKRVKSYYNAQFTLFLCVMYSDAKTSNFSQDLRIHEQSNL